VKFLGSKKYSAKVAEEMLKSDIVSWGGHNSTLFDEATWGLTMEGCRNDIKECFLEPLLQFTED